MVNKCRYCNAERKFTKGNGLEVNCCGLLKQDWTMSLDIEALEKELATAKKQRSKFREDYSQSKATKQKTEKA